MTCRVLVTADNAKMPGFVHMLCVASNRSLACCSTLYTYIDAVSITKPRALALCVRFAEVRHLPCVSRADLQFEGSECARSASSCRHLFLVVEPALLLPSAAATCQKLWASADAGDPHGDPSMTTWSEETGTLCRCHRNTPRKRVWHAVLP